TEEGAEKVRVVTGTTPNSGVAYIERFIEEHRASIEQRQAELVDNTEKDPYLLILTPARKMNFLKSGGARDAPRSFVQPYLADEAQLGDDYWRLADYFAAAAHPSHNFAVRKVLAHENVSQTAITELLKEALSSGTNLCDLDDETIKTGLERCEQIKDVLE